MTRFLSGKRLTILAAASISLVILLRAAGNTLENSVFSISGMAGCLLAIWLCLAVARDHRRGSFLRTAWLLFSGDAFMQFFRYFMDSPVGQRAISEAPTRDHSRALFVLIGLIFLLAGMMVLWLGLKRMGLGLRLLTRDIATLSCLGFLAIVVATAEITRIGWTLRTPILACMVAGAIVGAMLLRFARQIAEGQIYLVIQMLIAYLGTRCIQNLFIASGLAGGAAIGIVVLSLQTALPWILCIGAAARLRVTLGAEERLENIRRLEFGARSVPAVGRIQPNSPV